MVQENENRKEYPKRNCVDVGSLRMGNWVQHSGSGKPFIWTLERFWEYYVNPDKAYYYDPIPLTPQILEEAGFKKCSCGGYKSDLLHIGQDDKDRLYYKGVTITALHQLQNLYFSLTGKELQVNLK